MTFLLVVAFCVMGCAYNYAVQQRRGEDIVPGIGEGPLRLLR